MPDTASRPLTIALPLEDYLVLREALIAQIASLMERRARLPGKDVDDELSKLEAALDRTVLDKLRLDGDDPAALLAETHAAARTSTRDEKLAALKHELDGDEG